MSRRALALLRMTGTMDPVVKSSEAGAREDAKQTELKFAPIRSGKPLDYRWALDPQHPLNRPRPPTVTLLRPHKFRVFLLLAFPRARA